MPLSPKHELSTTLAASHSELLYSPYSLSQRMESGSYTLWCLVVVMRCTQRSAISLEGRQKCPDPCPGRSKPGTNQTKMVSDFNAKLPMVMGSMASEALAKVQYTFFFRRLTRCPNINIPLLTNLHSPSPPKPFSPRRALRDHLLCLYSRPCSLDPVAEYGELAVCSGVSARCE